MKQLRFSGVVAAVFLLMPIGYAATDETVSDQYQVVERDTLWSIAKRHGISVERLCELNGRKMDAPRWNRIVAGLLTTSRFQGSCSIPCG